MNDKKELSLDELDKVTGGGATNVYDTQTLLNKVVSASDDKKITVPDIGDIEIPQN